MPCGVRREHLAHVRIIPARQPRIEQCSGFTQNEVRGLGLRMRARNRKLYALVLPDWPIEHDPLFRIVDRGAREPARVADRFDDTIYVRH